MAIIDDVVRKTQQAGKFVAEKATDVYDLTKASYSLATLENKMDGLMKQIGTLTFEEKTEGASHEEKLSGLFEEAKALKEEIIEARVKKASLKNEIACPECGKFNDKDAVFCSACGKKLNEE